MPDMRAPRFHIHTFGCKVNRAESEKIAAQLLAAGWEQTDAASCDVAIVNTCTVTGEAEVKNRKEIRALLRAGCEHVIVTGCAINIAADHYADISSHIICECDKERIASRAAELLGLALPAARQSEAVPLDRVGDGFRTRVDMKVQDGCDNACTYCIVHTARGKARSMPARDVVAEARHHVSCGVNELVLVGIDLGAYNDSGCDLGGLLMLLQEQTDVGRIRISSIEPQNLNESLIACLEQSSGRVCRHLHLCLQSGSDKVLSEMARPYSGAKFLAKVRALRTRVPSIALSTDIIVGFPGESDEDFEATCKLVELCGFMRLHVFRYSKRPGTPAAARNDQIAPEIMARRSERLRELGARLAREDALARVGTCEQVIVERPGRGTSESYHPVRLDADIPVGSLVTLRFSDYDEEQKALVGNVEAGRAQQQEAQQPSHDVKSTFR